MGKVRSSNKKMKHALCYIALVILVILLFTPLVFRIVFKETPKKEEEVIMFLICNKGDESTRSSFINDEPQNISYTIVGDYREIKETEEVPLTEENNKDEETVDIKDNPVVKKLLNYSTWSFNDLENKSTISFNATIAKGSLDYEMNFANIDKQESFYGSQGFSCRREKYDQ